MNFTVGQGQETAAATWNPPGYLAGGGGFVAAHCAAPAPNDNVEYAAVQCAGPGPQPALPPLSASRMTPRPPPVLGPALFLGLSALASAAHPRPAPGSLAGVAVVAAGAAAGRPTAGLLPRGPGELGWPAVSKGRQLKGCTPGGGRGGEVDAFGWWLPCWGGSYGAFRVLYAMPGDACTLFGHLMPADMSTAHYGMAMDRLPSV